MKSLKWLWNMPAKIKLIVAGLIAALLLIAWVAHLSHERRRAEQRAREAKIEGNRQKDKADGLGILYNANTIAGEVEDEKKIANQQDVNSNASAAAFNNSRQRNSSEFSNNRAVVNHRFCENFPDDDSCR